MIGDDNPSFMGLMKQHELITRKHLDTSRIDQTRAKILI